MTGWPSPVEAEDRRESFEHQVVEIVPAELGSDLIPGRSAAVVSVVTVDGQRYLSGP